MPTLLPNGEQQFIDGDGKPYAAGFVYMYIPGTLTPKNTYQDTGGTIVNSNPVVLNAAGRGILLGSGAYRQILKDAAGNTIWDRDTEAPLADDAISSVMAPIVAATSLSQARDLMGVTSAISAAVGAVSLMPGPIGPTGPVGPSGASITGPTGPTGPAGSSGGGGSTGGAVQAGVATTDASGLIIATFTTPFATALVYASVTDSPVGLPSGLSGISFLTATTTGFSAYITDSFGNPVASTPIGWFSIGY